MNLTLESLLTSPQGFGLTTASPAQRAICRVSEGIYLDDDVWCAPGVAAAFGVEDRSKLPPCPPAELYLLSGIRTGKSLLAAAAAVRASQTCNLDGLGHGEVPRVSVLSLSIDLSRVVLDHIVGNVRAKPVLRRLLVGEPTTDSVMLRHPSGRPVEIKCVAGAKAGASLLSRWSAGAIFDEFTRMNGADDAIVNFDDGRAGVLGRLLPGAQLIAIGSPWAPFGPAYDVVQEHFGKPSSDLVVIRAPGPVMNPAYWTAERCATLQRRDPVVWRTDGLGEFADPETSLFSSIELARCTRGGPLELPAAGGVYVAAMDPASRSNAWTLVVLEVCVRDDIAFFRVVLARQWIGSKVMPLSPASVLAEIATVIDPYRCRRVSQDQWSVDAISDLASRHGLTIVPVTTTAATKLAMFDRLRALVANEQIELSPDPVLRSDLLSIRRSITQQATTIKLPRSSDGRHADYAPSLALALAQAESGERFIAGGRSMFDGIPPHGSIRIWRESGGSNARVDSGNHRAEAAARSRWDEQQAVRAAATPTVNSNNRRNS